VDHCLGLADGAKARQPWHVYADKGGCAPIPLSRLTKARGGEWEFALQGN